MNLLLKCDLLPIIICVSSTNVEIMQHLSWFCNFFSIFSELEGINKFTYIAIHYIGQVVDCETDPVIRYSVPAENYKF